MGTAVVVTQSGPVGVGIHAVMLTGRHTVASVQNQVPTVTTARLDGGAVRSAGRGNQRVSRLELHRLMTVGGTCGTHTSRFPDGHMLTYNR